MSQASRGPAGIRAPPGTSKTPVTANTTAPGAWGIWAQPANGKASHAAQGTSAGAAGPAAVARTTHSTEPWNSTISSQMQTTGPGLILDSSTSSNSVTDTQDEVLSRSPQNGRRGNSPDITRSNSPFLYRQRQATAAQAAALHHSPKDAFLDPRTTQQFPFPEDIQNRTSAQRYKSVMHSVVEDNQYNGGMSSGPTRSSSTPPFANITQISHAFTPNSNAPFFTPQVPQRGFFADSSRDHDLGLTMRNLSITDSVGSRFDPSPARTASPYGQGNTTQGSYGQHLQQNSHSDYHHPTQNYGEYGYSQQRPYEDEYGRSNHQQHYASQNSSYADTYPYGMRNNQRENYRSAPDEFSRAGYPPRSRFPQDRRGPTYGGDGYFRGQQNPGFSTQQPASYFDGRTGNGPYMQPRRDDPGAGLRSPMLEEFRNNKSRKYELTDILGHVVEFSGDQHGSRFIQQKLETANSDDKDAVFQEILPNCLQLMTDVFGNYVIQKFFEHGNQVQKTVLAKHMEGHVLTLSLQMYGCRVVQKALEHILAEQQVVMVKELDGSVLRCVKDQNGNHVVQKALERVPADKIQFIIGAFSGQAYSLATHPYGCRVIQRMLEYCPDAQVALLEELHRYTQNLVVDQYGNYVSQHIIERGAPADRSKVIDVVRGQVLALSKHKFASNVVEKCIAFGSPEERHELIEEALRPGADGQSAISSLMKDQYGNYVLQKMLEVGEEAQKNELASKIKPLLETMKKV